MLAIRMQRTGRSGHAQFRVIVQDSRFSPTRGRIVMYLGSYDPHTKTASIDGEKAARYLENGAQPSDTVARLFKKEGIKMPAWVKLDEPKKRTVRNPQKRRSTAPAQPEAAAQPVNEETPADTEPKTPAETPDEESSPAETTAEESAPAEETPDTEGTTPAEEPAAEVQNPEANTEKS
jgi:small subunit ribosomal protein S16